VSLHRGAGPLLLTIRALGHLGDLDESVEIVDGKIGEHLAVDIDASFPQSGHQAAVAHPLGACGGVDPGNPESAELTLLLAPVPIGIAHGALGGFLRRLVELAPAAAGTFGGLHDLLLPGVVCNPILDTRHELIPYA
jgi:hypothetical protein